MKKKYITAIISGIFLVSSQSFAATTNQVQVKNSIAPAMQTSEKIRLNITNQTGIVIKSIIIANSDNSPVLTLNKSNCKDVCSFEIKRNLLIKNSTIKFYDKSNKLVAAAFISTPSVEKTQEIYANNFSTGSYVFFAVNKIKPMINFMTITQSFTTTVANNHPIDLLGAYFLDKVASNNNNTRLVLSKLAVKLTSNNPKIEASPTSPRLQAAITKFETNPVKLGETKSGGYCSTGVQQGLGYFTSAASHIPLIGVLFEVFDSINEDACASDNFVEQFNQIN